MNSSIKIGFAGSYKCDYLLYFSRIALALGKTVSIVDATGEQFLNYSVPNYLNNTVVSYRGIDVFLGCKGAENYEQLPLDKYDIVFIDYGFNSHLVKYMRDCTAVILCTDFERYNVDRLRDYVKELAAFNKTNSQNKDGDTHQGEDEKVYVIKVYRDIVKSKINEKYIDHYLELNTLVEVTLEYIFYFDELDYKSRIDSQYNDFFKFNKLTKSHRTMFVDILRGVLELKDKEVIKALKKAERGL